ncbi:MAG TPA: hypothetical protein VFW48_03865 [Solirubrobacterales bacterium]|nr:hypothetical protein [Solirubrobacterales bacterium]
MVATLERLIRDIWRLRFRIPRRLFAGLTIVAALVLAIAPPSGQTLPPVVLALVIGLGGIVHWQVAKRCYSSRLIVPLFREGGAAAGFGAEAQALIIDDLRRHLPSALRGFVRAIPVTIGADEDQFAETLQRRLRAAFVLHGRVAARPEGGWSVFPRILEPAMRSTTHEDWFTRDRTPANPRFGPFVSSLKPQIGVQDEEFPLEFCRDLEALARGLVGLMAQIFGDYDRAITELDVALGIAGKSTNHQVDRLRVSRALALAGRGELDTAIESLKVRRRNPDPSPELLRRLSAMLLERARIKGNGREGKRDRKEAIKLLREAIDHEQDPQRDMSIYNLYALLDPRGRDREESSRLLDHLIAARSNYRRQWYVKRGAALRAWTASEEARAEGDFEAMKRHSRDSAKWYRRSIKARPRLQLLRVRKKSPFLVVKRFPPSPILYANAFDAYRNGGQRLRARWHEHRFQRTRVKLMNKGMAFAEEGNWVDAFANFDWTIVGRHDQREQFMETYAACCRWKMGEQADGLARWTEIHKKTPNGVFARSIFVQQLEVAGQDSSVPGSEPTDPDSVAEFIDKNPRLWSKEARVAFLVAIRAVDPDEVEEVEAAGLRLLTEIDGERDQGN